MRSVRVVCAMAFAAAGCTVNNPLFDDGQATSGAGGSATDVPQMPDPDTTEGEPSASGAASTSNDTDGSGRPTTSDEMSTGGSLDLPASFEPFRVPITFNPQTVELPDFVARVVIEKPFLEGIAPETLGFTEHESADPVPFELISYEPQSGRLDAWVLLEEWSTEVDPTIVDLVVTDAPVVAISPWDSYEHVWHLDGAQEPMDVTGMSMGQSSGYAPGDGLEPGLAGGARIFDGVDDLLEVPAITPPSATFAAYGWARVDALPTTRTPLFGRSAGLPSESQDTDNLVDWAITVNPAGEVQGLMRSGSGVIATTIPVALPAPVDGWHHYAIKSSPEEGLFRLFIDGVSSTLLTAIISTETSMASLSMGGWYGEDPAFTDAKLEGALDEVAVLDRELPYEWMLAIYDNHRAPETTYVLGKQQPL